MYNHGEGPYLVLLLVKSGFYCFHIFSVIIQLQTSRFQLYWCHLAYSHPWPEVSSMMMVAATSSALALVISGSSTGPEQPELFLS